MFEQFQSFDLMLQVFWIMALVSSVIFIIQAIGVFMGLDADADLDIDADTTTMDDAFDVDGFHLVSVKTVVCFILGFGWTGVLFWDFFENRIWLGLLACAVGLVFMALIAWLLYLVLKLDKDNTFRIKDAVGKTADVYLRIPANKHESGKITLSVNGSTHELEAMTEEAGEIPTGAKVRIVGIIEGETVLVESL